MIVQARRRADGPWLVGGAGLAAALVLAALAARSPQSAADDFVPAMALVAAASAAWLALQIDLAWTFSGVVALSVFSGQWAHVGLPVPGDRLALALGLSVLAWRAWAGELPAAAARPRHVRATAWLLAIVAAYAVVSAGWADTLADHEGFYGLLDRLGLVPFALFLAAPIVFGTERQRGILLGVLVALGGYLGWTALAEGLGLDALVFPHYITDPSIGIHVDRARGPFVEAVANGLALFACAVAAALALTRWRTPGSRAAALTVLVLCAVGIVLTLTRAVWIAGAAAPVVAMLCSPSSRRWLLPALLLGGVVAWGALHYVPGLQGKASSRTEDQRPVWDRLNTDGAALRMVGERPVLGWGWNSYVTRGTDELRQDGDYPLTGAGLVVHNVFLSNAVELGLAGFAVWLAAFVLGIGVTAALRAPPLLEPWRLGLIALAVNYVIVANFGPLGYAFPTLLLWTWAGIVAQRPREEQAWA